MASCSSAPGFSRMVAVLSLLGVVASCSGNSTGPFQPQVSNAPDNFQLQATNVANVTATLTYMWTNSGTRATIVHSTTTAAGSTLLVIKDAAGATVYSNALASSLNEPTNVGLAGTWSIELTLTNYSGTLNVAAQKFHMIAKPAAWALNVNQIASNWKWFWSDLSGWCLPMWENTGTALADLDDLNKPATMQTGSSWASDALGVAVAFNGTTGYASMNSQTGFGSLVGTGSFTAFAVVRPGATGAWRTMYADGTTAVDQSFLLNQTNTDKWEVTVFPSGTAYTPYTQTSTSSVVSGALAVLVFTWNMTNPAHVQMTFYVNGASEASADLGSVGPLIAGAGLTIGSEGWYGIQQFSGNMLMVGAQRGVWTAQHIADFSADPFRVLVQAP